MHQRFCIRLMICCQNNRQGLTFSKVLRKILGRFRVLGKSNENIYQSINLEFGNNNAIINVMNTFISRHVGCYHMILLNCELQYDTIEEFNVDSKAECDQLNLISK